MICESCGSWYDFDGHYYFCIACDPCAYADGDRRAEFEDCAIFEDGEELSDSEEKDMEDEGGC
jgi:hypothetical protein